jgi:hypothetical protein
MSRRNGNLSGSHDLRADSRLIRLHPREDSFEVSQGRTVLSTNRNGFIAPETTNGLFVHQTRMLSRYRWLVDGAEPQGVALSNVEQHSWLGYYIHVPPSLEHAWEDHGSGEMTVASERSLELRLSRSVGYGVHEDVDVTNFTQTPVEFELQLEVDADFMDQDEVATQQRQQFGELTRSWRRGRQSNWELLFDYVAHHHYEHQGDIGDPSIHRSIAIEIANCASSPHYSDNTISFHVSLSPFQSWHACIRMHPEVEDEPAFPLYDCYAFQPTSNPWDVSRAAFLEQATSFSSPECGTLTRVVVSALEVAKHDLAGLRLHDLDRDPDSWVPAAGIPIYVALFGRDTLTVAWEAAIVSSQMARGTLPVIADLQGKVVDDWRDEQPGRMLHEAHTGPLAKLGFNPRARYYGSATTSGFYPVVLAQLWLYAPEQK